VFTVAPTATAWEATATAVNVTVHPVHPFVPAATLDVAVTLVVPADADRLIAACEAPANASRAVPKRMREYMIFPSELIGCFLESTF